MEQALFKVTFFQRDINGVKRRDADVRIVEEHRMIGVSLINCQEWGWRVLSIFNTTHPYDDKDSFDDNWYALCERTK